jgi:CRISPR-associated protein Cas1
MLLKDLVATLVGVGLDPYLGFYHQPRYGRPALALDLMEEFRPLVADSVVINLINNGEVRPTDFITRAGACALTPHGRKQVLEGYERRLDTLVTHPRFGYAISYRRIFEVQARLLARLLTGEINFYPAFCTR